MSDYYHKYIGSYFGKIKNIFRGGDKTQQSPQFSTTKPPTTESIVEYIQGKFEFGYDKLPKNSKHMIRLAGVCGVAAIVMASYGSHVFRKRLREANKETFNYELKELYDTAQYYHMVHSVAMLGLPLVRQPIITGSLWVSGMVLFCGTMYYHAISGDGSLKMLTPFGGMCLIAGWVSLIV